MLLLSGRPAATHYLLNSKKYNAVLPKRLSGLSYMSYPDRLKTLSLPTLEGRRLTADLIFCYKIINGLVRLDPADFFVFYDSKTRGYKHKLVVEHSHMDNCQHFFCNKSCSSVEFLTSTCCTLTYCWFV